MAPTSTSNGASLKQKRHELITLLNHTSELNVDNEGEAMNTVQARLLAEIRRIEVEEMRRHIASCPGLSSSSPAFDIALPALDEALNHIDENSDKMEAELVTNPGLIRSIMPQLTSSKRSSEGIINRNHVHGSVLEDVDLLGRVPTVDSPGSSVSYTGDDADDTVQPKVTAKTGKSKRTSQRSILTRILGALLRCFILDLPLATSCLFLIASYSGRHIYSTYWVPVMDSLSWTDDRLESEYTNYMRECDAEDISTTNPDDFIIDPSTTTAEEAVEITNKHGMSIYPNILTPETAAAMREYVLRKNYSLTKDEAIWLISNENRWSFPIGADDDPAVPPVLQEVATNEMFQKAIEGIMGEDPAMVEFTAITSAYGAADQHWHADNDFTASQMHYGRSFVPMYSLFIPLQDTTARMGATSACPGTHLCGEESKLSNVCNDLNFQVADSRGRLAKSQEDHVWKSGDGFLMNLNTYHRGPGHTDPNGTERVMLILTISNRPEGPNFDRRQISLGTSYSLKWDMFGMTMKDLAIMDKIKGFPWKQLRTFGIYKPQGAHSSHATLWGWDYITVACSRIAASGMGFRYDDLPVWSDRMKRTGGLPFQYLFGYVPNEEDVKLNGWHEYFEETFNRCIQLGQIVFGATSVIYFVGSLLQKKKTASLIRGFTITTAISVMGIFGLKRIANSPWGQDITNGRIFNSPFVENYDKSKEVGDVTLPNKRDVLIPTRLDSPFLAGQNFIYDQQPGNAIYNDLLSFYSGSFGSTPATIRERIIANILDGVEKQDGRFLLQNAFGDWEILSDEDVTSLIEKALVIENNPISRSVGREVRYLISDCKHGKLRKTALSRKFALLNMLRLDDAMFKIDSMNEPPKPFQTMKAARLFVPDIQNLRPPKDADKKMDEIVLKVGDDVESFFPPDGWFKGKITRIKKGYKPYGVLYDDGDFQYQPKRMVRPFMPWAIGDEVRIVPEDEVGIISNIRAIGQIIVNLESNEKMIAYPEELQRLE